MHGLMPQDRVFRAEPDGRWGEGVIFSLRSALVLATAMTALATGGTAHGQTLHQAMANAYNTNPTLLAARAGLRVVDENVPQALSGWRPTVVMSGAYGYADAQTRVQAMSAGAPRQPFSLYTDVNRPTSNMNASVTQPLYRGGRTIASTRRSENQVYAQRARLLVTEQQVLQDVVTA